MLEERPDYFCMSNLIYFFVNQEFLNSTDSGIIIFIDAKRALLEDRPARLVLYCNYCMSNVQPYLFFINQEFLNSTVKRQSIYRSHEDLLTMLNLCL